MFPTKVVLTSVVPCFAGHGAWSTMVVPVHTRSEILQFFFTFCNFGYTYLQWDWFVANFSCACLLYICSFANIPLPCFHWIWNFWQLQLHLLGLNFILLILVVLVVNFTNILVMFVWTTFQLHGFGENSGEILQI